MAKINEVATWLFILVLQSLVGIVGGFALGFLPEAVVGRLYYNTGIEAYSPMIAVFAFLLGFFVSKYVGGGGAANWTWVVGLIWLLLGICEETRYWSRGWSPGGTRWSYAFVNFFGPAHECGATECLDEVFFTTPFTASIAYSFGSRISKWLSSREKHVAKS